MPAKADITDELDNSGQAIDNFIENLGLSVAKGQAALDKNTAEIAEKLSKTMVDIPSVIQETFDNNGNATAAVITNSQVPMSTIILPVAYQFSRVYFQADLKLSEVEKNSGIKLVRNAAKLRGSAKVNLDPMAIASGGVPGVNLGASGSLSTLDSNNTAFNGTDTSIATLHFEATLEPRREVQVPTPVRLRSAPRIMVALTDFNEVAAVAAVAASGTQPAVDAEPAKRMATITIKVFGVKGDDVTATALANLSATVDSPELLLTKPSSSTNSLVIVVERRQSGAEPMPSRAAAIVRVTLGALTEQISISI